MLFASSIYQFSDTPGPPIQCFVGAVVCVVQEIEKSTLLGGRRGGGGVGNVSKMFENPILLPSVSTLLSPILVLISCVAESSFSLSSQV